MISQVINLVISLPPKYLTAKTAQKHTQKGSVVVLMSFVIALFATYAVVKMFNQSNLQTLQQEKKIQNLNAAKQTLIAWAVSNRDHPGQLPFPDRNVDGDYNGTSDCNSPTSVFQYSFLIGQLPVLGRNNPCISPQENMDVNLQDAYGNRLWYAVSRNLVHKYELPDGDPVINSGIVSNPVYPWLRVLDRNGTLISDRVAVVIIAPGQSIGGQNRAGAANIDQFLDSITVNGVTYSNRDYDTADEDFIIGEDMKFLAESNPSVARPYLFNDQLVYITIDELINALNHRVAQELSWLLNSYRNKTGNFPNAADLSVLTIPGSPYIAGINTQGPVPIDATDNGCGCTSDTECSCSFLPINSVSMFRNSGTWNSAQDTGSCTTLAAGKECTCTGAGSCSRFSTSFVCDAAGTCTSTNLVPNPNNRFIYRLPTYADFYNPAPGCSVVGDNLECNNTSTFGIGLKEPIWFKANSWQEYMYYRSSTLNDISAGTQNGISALLIGVGDIINSEAGIAQARPSNNIQDYLDSIENIDMDVNYDSVLKKSTNAYNDQLFIISP